MVYLLSSINPFYEKKLLSAFIIVRNPIITKF
jgi:hypothetical protein